MHRRLTTLAACAAAAFASAPSYAQFAPPAVQPFAPQSLDCPSLIAQTEARRNIPRGLLMAIAMTESALNGTPNPYAMNIAGRAYHANGFQDMSSVITANYARGVRSIDVGCMQVNLLYHGAKFARYTDLLDPSTNVNYGATYLINLAVETGSWKDAVMSYHNRKNPSRRAYYGCAVWNNYLKISRATTGYISCGGRAPNTASVTVASARTQVQPAPVGSTPGPLSPSARNSTSGAATLIGNTPVTVGTRRATGNIMIVAAGEEMPEVLNNDGRRTAFRSIQPDDWTGRAAPKAQAASGVGSFGRITRAE